MFVFESGARLALWSSATVEPAVTQTVGAMELAFALPDDAAVDRLSTEWLARGLTLIQAPTRMEFGYTCMALDPDGHRLRLYCPAPNWAEPAPSRRSHVSRGTCSLLHQENKSRSQGAAFISS